MSGNKPQSQYRVLAQQAIGEAPPPRQTPPQFRAPKQATEDERIAVVESAVALLATRLDFIPQMAEAIVEMRTALQTFSSQVNHLTGSVDAMHRNQDHVRAAVASCTAAVHGVSSRLEGLERLLGTKE